MSVCECGLDLRRRDAIEVEAEPAPLFRRERQVHACFCEAHGQTLDDGTPAALDLDVHEGKLST